MLSFHSQIASIQKCFAESIGLVHKVSPSLFQKALSSFYQAFTKPVTLFYGLLIYGDYEQSSSKQVATLFLETNRETVYELYMRGHFTETFLKIMISNASALTDDSISKWWTYSTPVFATFYSQNFISSESIKESLCVNGKRSVA